jgi:hypothetical protein
MQHPTLRPGSLFCIRSLSICRCPVAHLVVSRSLTLLFSSLLFWDADSTTLSLPGLQRRPVRCLASASAANCAPDSPGNGDTRTPQLLDVFQPALCRTKFKPEPPWSRRTPSLITATHCVGRETHSFNHCALPSINSPRGANNRRPPTLFSSPQDHPNRPTYRAPRPLRRPRLDPPATNTKNNRPGQKICPSWLRNGNFAGHTWPARSPSRALTEPTATLATATTAP